MRIVTIAAVLLATGRIAFAAACPNPVLTQAPSLPASHNPLGIAVADFDKDLEADYAVPSTFDSNLTVYLGNGDGTFATGVPYPTGGTNAQRLVTADFNSDTWPDLATLDYNTSDFAVLLNDGDGTFAAGVRTTVPANPYALQVGDFNGDTKPDLVVTSFATTVKVFYGEGNGTFPSSDVLSTPSGSPLWATGGDINDDSKDDVVLVYTPTGSSTNSLAIFIRGVSAFLAPTIISGLPGGNDAVSYAADLNADGWADVVTLHKNAKKVLVFLNNGTGALNAPTTYTLGQEPAAVIASDITDDTVPDLLFATGNGNVTTFMLGNGDGTFQAPIQKLVNSANFGVQNYGVGAADIDGNGHKDILLSDSYNDAVHIFLNYCPTKTTTTALTSSKSSSIYNEYVQFTATVTTNDGGVATDHALFMDGDRIIGPVPLSNTNPATASLFTQSLSAGEHVMKAVFEGNEEYAPSFGTIAHTVTRLPFGAPQLFSANANTNSVSLSWVGTDDSASYEVWRMSGGGWQLYSEPTAESYQDNMVTQGEAYFYRVRARRTGTGEAGPYAPANAAVLRVHTLPTTGMTIAASHTQQFRDSVNLIRGAAGLGAFSFTDPDLPGVTIKAIHLEELRTAALQALSTAGGEMPTFSTITPGVTKMSASDLMAIWELVR